MNCKNYTAFCELHSFQVSYPPVSQRLAWTQPLAIISDVPTPPVVYQQSETLPALSSVVKSTTTTWGQMNGNNQLPRPPPAATIRSRPLSAGSATIASRRVQAPPSSSPPVQHRGEFDARFNASCRANQATTASLYNIFEVLKIFFPHQ